MIHLKMLKMSVIKYHHGTSSLIVYINARIKHLLHMGPCFLNLQQVGFSAKSIDCLTNLTSKLNQDKTVIICDHVIYEIAIDMAIRYSEKYSNLVI